MSLSIDQFKAKLANGGARANLFKVICNFPSYAGGNSELTSYMVKAASLPGSVIGNVPVPFRGRVLNLPGDRTYEPWTITVLNDTTMEVRNAFEKWAQGIQNQSQNKGKQKPSEYLVDLTVQQLDRNEKVTKEYKIIGAYPTNISSIDLASDTNDAVEEFTVDFTYQYWTSTQSAVI